MVSARHATQHHPSILSARLSNSTVLAMATVSYDAQQRKKRKIAAICHHSHASFPFHFFALAFPIVVTLPPVVPLSGNETWVVLDPVAYGYSVLAVASSLWLGALPCEVSWFTAVVAHWLRPRSAGLSLAFTFTLSFCCFSSGSFVSISSSLSCGRSVEVTDAAHPLCHGNHPTKAPSTRTPWSLPAAQPDDLLR